MFDDLELAGEANRDDETPSSHAYRDLEEEWIDDLRKLRKNEKRLRQRFGDDFYNAYFKMVRWNAQRALLGRSGVDIPVLSWMYGRPKGLTAGISKEDWAYLQGM